MASLSVYTSQYSMYLSFLNLEHPEGDYDQFAFQVGPDIINSFTNGVTFYGLDCNTSYICAGAAKYNGVWYTVEPGASYTTDACIPPPDRPLNFAGWGITVTAGQPAAITATKWNEFADKINQFRDYKGLSVYGFTGAVQSDTITAIQANQLRASILPMNSSVPALVSTDDTITASWLNAITDALNSIV